MSDMNNRISDVIRAYDAQGWHRTATEADNDSARWLADCVRDLGLSAHLDRFPLDRVDPHTCVVAIDGQRIDGVPLFDGGLTTAEGVVGRLGGAADQTDIAVIEMPVNAPQHGPLAQLRRAGRHQAIIVVTRGGLPGLAIVNAPQFAAPFGPPVLQVASEHGERLMDAARRGSTARVIVHAEVTPSEAINVVTRVAGADHTLPPLVVMTPRSGWWQCASERGGGIACWLEAMRSVVNARPRRDVQLIASSGHELGHHGLKAFLRASEGLGTHAHAWIHFGANIGAATGDAGRLAASDDALETVALDALSAHAAPTVRVAERGWVPNGEAHEIHLAGGRYVSLVGGNAHFHLESDRWPDAVDVPAVAAYAAAFRDVARSLACVD